MTGTALVLLRRTFGHVGHAKRTMILRQAYAAGVSPLQLRLLLRVDGTEHETRV